MKTISAIAQKGGTGKTTLLLNLATEFMRGGYLTAIMDIDPQPSAMAWSDLRQNRHDPAVLDIKASRLAQAKEAAEAEGLDVLLIDTGGRTDEGAFMAAQLSDLVMVPMQPSAIDLKSMAATQQLIARAGAPRTVAVLSRVKAAGNRHLEAAEGLRADGWTVLDAMIGDRVAFQDAYAMGLTVSEYGGSREATAEVQQLYKSICQQADMPTNKKVSKPTRQVDRFAPLADTTPRASMPTRMRLKP